MKPLSSRLLRSVRGARRAVVALGILGVVAGLLAIAQAIVLAALVVDLVRGDGFAAAALWLVAVLAARGVVSAVSTATATRAGTRVSCEVRSLAVRHALALPADRRPPAGELMTTVTGGATSVEPYVARYLPALVSAAVLPGFAVLALLITDWPSALIVVVTLPLLPLFAALIGRHTQAATDRRWRALRTLSGHFLDVMRGLPTLASYQRAEPQADVVREVGERHRVATVRTLRIAFLSTAALEMLATISVAMVAVCVGLRLAYGVMDLRVALTAILLTPEAYWPIRRVGQEFHAAADGATALDDLLPAETAPSHPAASARPPAEITLTYRHPGADTDVLRGVRIPLEAGLTVLTGPSGCGKTTALELLAGLRGETAPRWRAHLVTQRPFLVPGSLSDNLRLGAGRDASDADLQAAARRTGLDAVLRGEKHALHTQLGDDGIGLSAGQRALPALTRALLDDAPVLLLDEPTAHLDTEIAHHVRKLVCDLARDRTVVAATHDPVLMALADYTVDLTAEVA